MTLTRLSRHVFSILAMTVVSLCLVQAQTNQSGLVSAIPGGTSANFIFAKPGDITILVEVWGFVQRPGRYELATTINLINLVSLAGGPLEEARIDNIRITRIVKDKPAIQRDVFIVNLEDLTRVAETELVLHPGDIIYVDRVAWSSWKEAIGYVLPLLSLGLALVQIYLIITH